MSSTYQIIMILSFLLLVFLGLTISVIISVIGDNGEPIGVPKIYL